MAICSPIDEKTAASAELASRPHASKRIRKRHSYDFDHFDHRPAAALRAISLRLSGESLAVRARPPLRAISPVAILAPMTEAPSTSADRCSPLGPLAMGPRIGRQPLRRGKIAAGFSTHRLRARAVPQRAAPGGNRGKPCPRRCAITAAPALVASPEPTGPCTGQRRCCLDLRQWQRAGAAALSGH